MLTSSPDMFRRCSTTVHDKEKVFHFLSGVLFFVNLDPLYFSDPWYPAANADVAGLVYYPEEVSATRASTIYTAALTSVDVIQKGACTWAHAKRRVLYPLISADGLFTLLSIPERAAIEAALINGILLQKGMKLSYMYPVTLSAQVF